ncbi:thiazole biosynthesis [Lucifera butyrica]|uniref:Thiazole synthase n=1 Tax=Lucifera butyrica TaxID=1351585 RepID=A0A498R527_9FIRM|nr:thiazole synthase [Lucifera butyrica]VBB05927.1 thiazole biosynthesis [Lucifera butyrica]
MEENWKIAGKTLRSRLIVGTGKYADQSILPQVMQAAETDVVTVAVRRMNLAGMPENIMDSIPADAVLMPNTSGARNAAEAVRIARLAKAAGYGDWIKIEVIGDARYLLPDNQETIEATRILAAEGFTVFPYMNPDLYAARALVAAGATAIMPLGAPIGSNRGLETQAMLRILLAELPDMPIIVDAGIGRPSEAAAAMEMGAAAVMVNTAIASAKEPVKMAAAFAKAVAAGRLAYLAGPGSRRETAVASSPLTGFLRREPNHEQC